MLGDEEHRGGKSGLSEVIATSVIPDAIAIRDPAAVLACGTVDVDGCEVCWIPARGPG